MADGSEAEIHTGAYVRLKEASRAFGLLKASLKDDFDSKLAAMDTKSSGKLTRGELRTLVSGAIGDSEKFVTEIDDLTHDIYAWLLDKDEEEVDIGVFKEHVVDAASVHDEPYVEFKELAALAARLRAEVSKVDAENVFKFYDKENNGHLTLGDMAKMCKRCLPKEERLKFHNLNGAAIELMHWIDTAGNGTLGFDEFAEFIYDDDESVASRIAELQTHLQRASALKPGEFLAMLRAKDAEKDGNLTSKEIAAALAEFLDNTTGGGEEGADTPKWETRAHTIQLVVLAETIMHGEEAISVDELHKFLDWLASADLAFTK